MSTGKRRGPWVQGRNWAADAGDGSIHDDATAERLGFRGGTVPGDVHANQFVPPVLEHFGDAWWHQGFLCLDFRRATVDREAVRVELDPAAASAHVQMVNESGEVVAQGSAGVGPLPPLEAQRARFAADAAYRILHRVSADMDLGSYDLHASSERQRERMAAGVISEPLSTWTVGLAAGIPACPATFVEFLWAPPMEALRPRVDPRAVGLFGAIDIAHRSGPFLLDRRYRVSSRVLGVGSSPKTELLWFHSEAADTDGTVVAEMRMMLRFMKASIEDDA
ncbi:MAG: hypothetical protein AAF648_05705 [Pseudomonadota bacterium]